MTVFWPALIGGVVLLIGSYVIIRNREQIARGTAQAQRGTFGRVGERTARSATPGSALLVGVVFACMGVAAVVMSFLNLNW